MNTNESAMWTAVVERDRAFDGEFVYAVKTTGIYCRPTCPSRRPKKENVAFFQGFEAAGAAGYRPCSRCRPHESRSRTEMIVETVRNYIDEHLEDSPTLDTMSKAVGVSPFHLQRVFKQETGLTPREYADAARLAKLKRELSSGKPVTESLYEVGYGSPSRLYERSSKQLGMTPGSYKKRGAGELIHFAFIRSQLGILLLAATERGVCFLQFGETEDDLKQALWSEFSAANIVENAEALAHWIEAINQYLSGRVTNINVPLEMHGTTFEKAVWGYLCEIPAGETRTYSEVAQAIGHPKAVRAVARACACNRVALAIPCHRVVRQDGNLAGYRWGLEKKKALLEREMRNAITSRLSRDD